MKLHTLPLLACLCALPACSVGPDYRKPDAPLPAAFKEGQGWKLAEPHDAISRGEWWQIFCDDTLNRLEAQLSIDNQNLKAAEARLRQAQALVAQTRAGFLPSVEGRGQQTRQLSATTGRISTSYDASLNLNWEIDLWGKIRRSTEASLASAEASKADLESARLSAQAELASNYLNLRITDEQKRLLDETVTAYRRSLALTEDLYNNGFQTRADYLQAKVQLESAEAQALDTGVQRAAYEHAIAVLIGKAPSDFLIAPVAAVPQTPDIPLVLPSAMLERRPDIAAAERRMQAANAQIGVAIAAFFPDISLSSAAGFISGSYANWFLPGNRVWSVGPAITQTVFDAGLRRAKTKEAVAAYDEAIATYRQSVLTALQEVEDQLAALRILEQEKEKRIAAREDSKASTQVIYNQYKEGIVSYLNVVNAQTTELNNALAALTVKRQRLAASVTLIKALGGQWATASRGEVTAADFLAAPPAETSPAQPTLKLMPPPASAKIP